MAEITALMVKELREKTGAGMLDCKKALTESAGDIEAAIDWLRAKGLSAAAKKSGRVAAEGLVALSSSASRGVIIELNSETDFVSRNDKFQALAANIAKIALDSKFAGDVEKLKQTQYTGSSKNIGDEVVEAIAVIGENINLRRGVELESDIVVSYVHNSVAPNLGKIGVLVGLKSTGDAEKVRAFGKQVAMHVAASRPESLNVSELDPALIERERQIFIEQTKDSGKPAEIIEKMVEGRIRKYYAEVVLLEQAFVIDGKTPVKDELTRVEKELGAKIEITGFKRLTLGEGVEKKEEDFAAEVKAAAGN